MDVGLVVPLNSRTSYWDLGTELSILVDPSRMLRRQPWLVKRRSCLPHSQIFAQVFCESATTGRLGDR